MAASIATACMLCQAASSSLSGTYWLSCHAGQAELSSGLQQQTAMAPTAQRCQGYQPAHLTKQSMHQWAPLPPCALPRGLELPAQRALSQLSRFELR